MKKILVVEDDGYYFSVIKEGLEGKVEILRAIMVEQAEKIFEKTPDFDLIVMDACVPGSKVTTIPLVEKIIKSGYNKPIIASSANESFRQYLLNAGATHEAKKLDVANKVLELLNLS